jgi:o-succinylbenzoate---CoA ligase
LEAALQYLDPEKYFSSSDSLRIFHHSSLSQEATELREVSRDLNLHNHFGVFSSGTSSSQLKGYIHSLHALEANARAVNKFFKLGSEDTWGLSLPDYHIGGLQVLLRAKLSGAKVVDLRGWEPMKWVESLATLGVRVTSVVPTQVYDLVASEVPAPKALHLLIVGGDFLSKELEIRAKKLGWPVIRTFGMTEAGSQIASTLPGTTSLSPLPIHQLSLDERGLLKIKSPALFSYRFEKNQSWDLTPVESLLDSEGFYQTQDEVDLKSDSLTPFGRSGDYFKTGGHLVRLGDLREILQKFLLENALFGKAEVYFTDDERKGKKVILLHEDLSESDLTKIVNDFKPVKLDEVRLVEKIDRTALGKAMRL